MRGCQCRGQMLCETCQSLAQRAGVLAAVTEAHISERAFQHAVLRIARQAGYMTFHVFDSRKSPEGYPDVTLCHPTRRDTPIFLCELKTASGQVTPAQAAWVEALDARTTVSAIWRPDDLPMIRRWLTGEDRC